MTHEELGSLPRNQVKTPAEGEVSLVAKETKESVSMELDCKDQSTLKIGSMGRIYKADCRHHWEGDMGTNCHKQRKVRTLPGVKHKWKTKRILP